MKIFYININSINDSIITIVKTNLPIRYEYALTYKNHDDVLRSIGGSYLLYKCVPNFDENLLKYTPKKKPYIENEKCFNISHSGDYSILAVDDNEIGVDIQQINEDENIRKIPMIKEEFIDVNNAPYEKLYEVWTIKESVIKLTGEGISDIAHIKDKKLLEKYFTKTTKFGDYMISVCSTHKIEEIELIEVK